MTMASTEPKALLEQKKPAGAAQTPVIVDVARKHGVSPFRQMREMFRLARGPGKLSSQEYYATGAYHPDLTMDQKRQLVGVAGSYALNIAMSPDKLATNRTFIQDKVVYTALLAGLGFATTRTLAVAQQDRLYGDIRSLSGPEEIREFLSDPAIYPLFAKPARATGSFGSALLQGLEDGQLVLGNGRRIAVDTLCAEIAADYPDGYLFQQALTQHSDLSDVAGTAIGTVRVVTVRDGDMPRMLYALWKIPSPTAMSDNFWQDGSMIAPVDAVGRVGRCRIGSGPQARDVDAHPVSGRRFEDVTIPFFDQIPELASRAHAVFPEFGIIGWDIAITPESPVLIEANDNPYHALYQNAFCRGIRNADFMPVFDRVTAASEAMFERRKALYIARQNKKKGKG